jgi:hypothetical protein
MLIQHPLHNSGQQFNTNEIAGNKLAVFIGQCADIALAEKDTRIKELEAEIEHQKEHLTVSLCAQETDFIQERNALKSYIVELREALTDAMDDVSEVLEDYKSKYGDYRKETVNNLQKRHDGFLAVLAKQNE